MDNKSLQKNCKQCVCHAIVQFNILIYSHLFTGLPLPKCLGAILQIKVKMIKVISLWNTIDHV